MKVYTLENHQFIKAPLKNVFDFFSKPENLKEITPSKLNFKILTPTPISMKEGTMIDYTIELFGIPLHWRTLITKFDPPNQFIDEQLKGPYLFWHHTHTFIEKDGGVEMSDKVLYTIPMGFFGRFLHFIWIKNDLKKIFSHREKVIDKILANNG